VKHGSLFSGIGGFDLAAEWMGWENVFHCEWNDFGKKVLNYYWPKAISYHDITKTDFTIHRGQIDILTGGFPCQPYSAAGKRKGKEDDRHLWPEMLRVIREVQPKWIVGENVLGLVNWNGGLVFEEVCTDLEAEGYEVQPYVLPAASVGAPHRRDRVWFVAYSNRSNDLRDTGEHEGESEEKRLSERDEVWESGESDKPRPKMESVTTNSESKQSKRMQSQLGEVGEQKQEQFRGSCSENVITNAMRKGFWEPEGNNGSKKKGESVRYTSKCIKNESITNPNGRRLPLEEHREAEPGRITEESISNYWENFPTVSPVLSGDDGIRSRVDTETISFPKWRNESIKAAGNAVVPQVVYQIFKAIEQWQ
jgi:DNA (cytosine-5)-methyltransferase 1